MQLHGINIELPDEVLALLDEDEIILFNIKQKRHRPAINIESKQMNF